MANCGGDSEQRGAGLRRNQEISIGEPNINTQHKQKLARANLRTINFP